MPDVFSCEIIENKILTDAVYSITVASQELSRESVAGQFLHIKCGEARILRRPISICNVKDDKVNFVFEVKGEGTNWLSKRQTGQKLNILGPLGNGFTVPKGKNIVIGGGVGTPPMLYAAQMAENDVIAILGFRSADRVILVDEFKSVCKEVFITTDDGSVGIHGAVTKPLEELLKSGKYETVMSCGQIQMQKAVADLCKKFNVPCQVSLEERMGCGVGACLVCACSTLSKVGTINESKDLAGGSMMMSRVCIDGPVFDAGMVVW